MRISEALWVVLMSYRVLSSVLDTVRKDIYSVKLRETRDGEFDLMSFLMAIHDGGPTRLAQLKSSLSAP